MSLKIKIKHFLGIDSQRDYLWLNAKEYNSTSEKTIGIKETCRLNKKCSSNIIVNEDICLSIDNEFNGIVIGKQKSCVRIKNKFNGLISCELLILCPEAEVTGEIYAKEIVLNNGCLIDGDIHRTKHQITDLKLIDLTNLSFDEFRTKYNGLINIQNNN